MQALKKGKRPVDYQVENALYKRAVGYRTTEVKTIEEVDENGDFHILQRITVEKDVPPDTTAQIFWLKNRRRDKWSDRPQDIIDKDEAIDDGFINALKGTAEADWSEDED